MTEETTLLARCSGLTNVQGLEKYTKKQLQITWSSTHWVTGAAEGKYQESYSK